MVYKLVAASISYKKEGFHHEVIGGIGNLKPEQLEGSPFQEAYAKIAPNPEDWPKLIEKVNQLNRHIPDCPPEAIKSIKTPMLIIAGDSDVIRPEHAIEIFRLLGGGVPGDLTGLPDSQLAILPGTTHITLVERANWLLSMITEFLDAHMPELE